MDGDDFLSGLWGDASILAGAATDAGAYAIQSDITQTPIITPTAVATGQRSQLGMLLIVALLVFLLVKHG